jgi:hypothetical protein
VIVPERFLVRRASSDVRLRCVQTRHTLVRSFADFATRKCTHRLSEKLQRDHQKRFNGRPRPRPDPATPLSNQQNQIQNP